MIALVTKGWGGASEKKTRAVGDPLGFIGHGIVKSHRKWDSVPIWGKSRPVGVLLSHARKEKALTRGT